MLNYGQTIFEGMKAMRSARGNIVLFRPADNAARMRDGAARMSMAAPPEALFLDAVVSTVRANAEMVPPAGKGSLYLRPLLLGTGPIVGLGPAPAYTFTVFATAVGSYFKVRRRPRTACAPAMLHSDRGDQCATVASCLCGAAGGSCFAAHAASFDAEQQGRRGIGRGAKC